MESPLHAASVQGHTRVALCLLKHKADIHSKAGIHEVEPLLLAAQGPTLTLALALTLTLTP